MFAVEMLPGGHGDALVVEYGTKTDPHQLLIDVGTFHAWDGVRKELIRRRRDRYEVFVVTHVDEDHIGGAIALLDDPDLKHRIDHVWFNGFVHCERGGNVLGPVNGEQLTNRIVGGRFRWNQGFTPKDRQHRRTRRRTEYGRPPLHRPPGERARGAAVADWPEAEGRWRRRGKKLSRRRTSWPVPATPAIPRAQSHATARRIRCRIRSTTHAIKRLAAKNATDRSAANGSSIAFILEYDDKRVLFGADAHAPVLTEALKRYAKQVGEARPRIDLVKLSHHGSNANLSTAMLALIDCRRFLISTNGDNFAHPDDAAIAKVIATSGGPVTFFCNYRSARTAPWEKHGPGVGATFEFPKANQHFMRVPA